MNRWLYLPWQGGVIHWYVDDDCNSVGTMEIFEKDAVFNIQDDRATIHIAGPFASLDEAKVAYLLLM